MINSQKLASAYTLYIAKTFQNVLPAVRHAEQVRSFGNSSCCSVSYRELPEIWSLGISNSGKLCNIVATHIFEIADTMGTHFAKKIAKVGAIISVYSYLVARWRLKREFTWSIWKRADIVARHIVEIADAKGTQFFKVSDVIVVHSDLAARWYAIWGGFGE